MSPLEVPLHHQHIPGAGKWVALCLALAFVALAIFMAQDQTTFEAWKACALTALCFAAIAGVGFTRKPSPSPDETLILWIAEHRDEIASGSALYNDIRVTLDTKLVQYRCAVGLVAGGFLTPSRLYIQGEERTAPVAIFYTVVSLLFGWWALEGPLFTLRALWVNLRGGSVSTVRDLCDQIEAYEDELRARGAQYEFERSIRGSDAGPKET